MANPRRGEIEAELGGRKFNLCLTLGALAELEQKFGEPDLVGVARRIEQGRLSTRDLLAIIACGIAGAGGDLAEQDVAKLGVDGGLSGYVTIASRLLAATFGVAQPLDAPSNPPSPQNA